MAPFRNYSHFVQTTSISRGSKKIWKDFLFSTSQMSSIVEFMC